MYKNPSNYDKRLRMIILFKIYNKSHLLMYHLKPASHCPADQGIGGSGEKSDIKAASSRT